MQLLYAAAGLTLGLALPRVRGGPTVKGGQLVEPLFTVGLGVIGVVTIVFSLLFGVVQWSASTFTPRLNLFRDDPLVWRTFAFAIGVFVFSVTAGLASGTNDRVSLLVPITAVVAALVVFALIRALQTRAFLSLQLGQVLAAVVARGLAVIGDVYPLRSSASDASAPAAEHLTAPRRTVIWAGPPGVIQQFDLRRLVDAATHADALVVFRLGVGDTVHEATPLADLHRGDLADGVVRAAVVRGAERSFDQDPMLAVRLLADIGLRALSPAVNDPATAVDAVDATEGLLCALAARELWVDDITDRAGVSRVRLVLPTWEDYLRTGVQDLLPAASAPMVLERMQRLVTNLFAMSPPSRHTALNGLDDQVRARRAADSAET
ncbi:DUF2254 family protein [Nocardioides sp. LHG3406-4]|uniref:DUF2254 family protein n=1 Tax=Nocardioides sp. LHG3406-4 TaxID=2804575 RepID=UPI003CF2F04C